MSVHGTRYWACSCYRNLFLLRSPRVCDVSLINHNNFYPFRYFIIPVERGFHCSDPTITKPWLPNTIGNTHLLIVSLGVPFFIILACEAVLFYEVNSYHYYPYHMVSFEKQVSFLFYDLDNWFFEATGQNRITKFFSSSTFFYLEYLLVYLACTIVMEMIK